VQFLVVLSAVTLFQCLFLTSWFGFSRHNFTKYSGVRFAQVLSKIIHAEHILLIIWLAWTGVSGTFASDMFYR